MPINTEQLRKINENYNNNCPNKACPSCGHSTWSIQSEFVYAPQFVSGRLNMQNGIALVAYVCDHCFTTKFFSAASMGIM